jgi:hypothetical protein
VIINYKPPTNTGGFYYIKLFLIYFHLLVFLILLHIYISNQSLTNGTTNKMMKLPLTEDDILNMDWSTPVTQTKITPEPLQLTKAQIKQQHLKKHQKMNEKNDATV